MRFGKPLQWVLFFLLIYVAKINQVWVLWPNSGKLLKLMIPSSRWKHRKWMK
jgi:hypothetical protein